MNKYHKDAFPLRFAAPSTVSAVLGALILLIGGVILCVGLALRETAAALAYYISMGGFDLLGLGAVLLCLAV